jgi:steroid 5-alpha reductase family enzyme
MIIEALLANAAILFGLALILWVVALQLDDVSFVEAFRGGGIALLALLSWLQLAEPGSLATLLMVMTVVWGVGLALHRLLCWRRDGEDPRYADLLRTDRTEGRFALAALVKVFLLQALLMFVVSSPAQYGILEAGRVQGISGLALVGLALFVLGIALEWIGEWQRARSGTRRTDLGSAREGGLRRLTRSPVPTGQALVWWGIWIAAASAGWWVAAATAIGPIVATAMRSIDRR